MPAATTGHDGGQRAERISFREEIVSFTAGSRNSVAAWLSLEGRSHAVGERYGGRASKDLFSWENPTKSFDFMPKPIGFLELAQRFPNGFDLFNVDHMP
jgi:hypothetical protein